MFVTLSSPLWQFNPELLSRRLISWSTEVGWSPQCRRKIIYSYGQVLYCTVLYCTVLYCKIRTEFGSRALGLLEDVWHQKYENKNKGLQNAINSILDISYLYRALNPIFGQNRISNTVFQVYKMTSLTSSGQSTGGWWRAREEKTTSNTFLLGKGLLR